jgi:predicted nucleotidyltransferase
VIILEPNNNLNGYFAPEEILEATGIRNYGDFHELAYPIKLEKAEIIGGFDTKTFREVYAPRRFELRPAFDGQSFIIYKERTGSGGIIKGTVKKILTSRGIDQVAGVKWAGEQIAETWQSKKLSKNILDFTFTQDSNRILVLYEEEKGCALEALR